MLPGIPALAARRALGSRRQCGIARCDLPDAGVHGPSEHSTLGAADHPGCPVRTTIRGYMIGFAKRCF
jgi:hypothetical protein